MPSFSTPPRPRFALRLGVTGHRPGDRLPAAETDRIAREIASILDRLKQAAGDAARRHSAVLDDAEPQLTLLCALAEGADRIAAEQALAKGWRLDVVLPFEAALYEEDFASAESKSTFRQLFGKAASVFCLAMAPEAASRPRAYQTAGHVTLDNADLLLAVWDGDPPRGAGGTAELVHDALARGVPVLHVHATEPVAPAYLKSGRNPAPLRQDLGHLVEWLTAPPQDRSGLDCFLGEAGASGASSDGRLLRWWRFSNRLATLFRKFGGRHDGGHPTPQEDAERKGAAGPAEVLLHERYSAADAVSTHLGHVYRSAFMFVFLLATLAVLAGLGNVFTWENVHVKMVAVGVELSFILLILLITRRGKRRAWHRRWLETRRLAELLRVAEIMAPAGGGAPIARDEDEDKGSAWTEWYARASLREAAIPNATADQSYLRDLANDFVSGPLATQIRYNQNASRDSHRLHHGLDRIGFFLFFATLIISTLFLIAEAALEFGPFDYPSAEEFLKQWVKPAVTLFSAGLPALGAALYGIRAQGDYEASATRSEATARKLLSVRDRILLAREAPDIAVLRDLFAEAAEIMQTDLSDWRQIYRHRPIALPA